jgi:hypothetical protein
VSPRPADRVLLRSSSCRRAGRAIPQIAAGDSPGADPVAETHVSRCLRCQAEVVAYRRLLRVLHSMRHDLATPPPDSLSALLAALDEAAERAGSPAGWAVRVAYVGGLTAAAGAAGVLVWMTRRRPGYAEAG